MAATGELIRLINYVDDIATTLRRIQASLHSVDADERKLAKEFRKTFRTSAEDRVRIDLSAWKMTAPKMGQREAVQISFPKTMDHKALERFVTLFVVRGGWQRECCNSGCMVFFSANRWVKIRREFG